MPLLERIAAARQSEEGRYSADQWLTDYMLPTLQQFNYGGHTYPLGLNQTLPGVKAKEIASTLPGFAAALRTCPPAFAAEMVRALIISQARFTFRNLLGTATPRRMFGNSDLGILEKPWPNATTGELLARMEWHAGLAGNSFVTRRSPRPGQQRLRVLRPDWTVIIYGSQLEPDDPGHALDGEILGYAYQNGGFTPGNVNPVRNLRVEDTAHWSPLPDPLSPGMGMSWVTPAVREIQGDRAMTEHKLRFFANGATPNMVVKGLPAVTKQQFDDLVNMLEEKHSGLTNAYRTLYLTGGADVSVVGADLKQLDFTAVQGRAETRIALLSRVPAPILQISEGLSGSSLNAGNFGMARRILADSWTYPTLQDVSRALAPLVKVPADAELWFDTADMPMLREDAKDAAEIEQIKATTISKLVTEGFTPESSIAAVMGQNMNLLKHSGLVSVQLQPPGTTAPPPNGAGNGSAPGPVPAAKPGLPPPAKGAKPA